MGPPDKPGDDGLGWGFGLGGGGMGESFLVLFFKKERAGLPFSFLAEG